MPKVEDSLQRAKENDLLLADRYFVDTIHSLAHLIQIEVERAEVYAICSGKVVSHLNLWENLAIYSLKKAYQFVIDTIDTVKVDFSYVCDINQKLCANLYDPPTFIDDENNLLKYPFLRSDLVSLKDHEDAICEILRSSDGTEKAINFMLYLFKNELFLKSNTRTAILCVNRLLIENGVGLFYLELENIAPFKEKLLNAIKTQADAELKAFILEKCIKVFEQENQEELKFLRRYRAYEAQKEHSQKNVH